MAAFSSRGPAADGRIKPDLVAPGTDIVSARSRASSDTGWGVLGSNTNYCFLGGTSMATPLAAGAATLVRQYCVETLGLASPSAALLKAALVGRRPFADPRTIRHQPIPRNSGTAAAQHRSRAGARRCRRHPLPAGGHASRPAWKARPRCPPGDSNSFVFSVHSNAPLTVGLAYSDYPSALSAAVNLVNDLDLLLLDPDGAPHHPNGLGRADRLNNVEGIDVADAATGRWTLVVSAPNVPQGPQPYALYLRGAIHLPVDIAHEPLDNT